MSIPRIAIVGRPNAGKSSLMNMIAGAKVSIVDPTPGVTRDRVTAIVDLAPPDGPGVVKPVEFVDTGGFGVYVAEGARYDEIGADLAKLTDSIEFQINQATQEADLVLFAIDAQQGITPQDEEIARLLRERRLGPKKGHKRSEAPGSTESEHAPGAPRHKAPEIRIVATKVDGPKWEAHAAEFSGLGFGEPLMVSAKNNYFRRDFMDAIYGMLPEPLPEDAQAVRADLMIAIIGKRNAGKSALVNTLAGEDRMIVSEIAGTTRDAVDVRFELNGRSMIAIDTAGLRRKRSFQNAIEHFAFDRAKRAIDRADVVLLLLDATEPISQVDEQLAHLARDSYKPVIIVVNKWDLVEGTTNEDDGKPVTTERYEQWIRRELRGLPWAPISFTVGQSGRNVKKTVELAFELKAQCENRVTTGKLNRLVRAIMETSGPTDTKGTFAKVFYVAQTGIAPPTITLVVNHPDLFTPNYLRFLENRFREQLPFPEVPMRIVIRARRQREDDLPSTAEGEEGSVRVSRGRKGTDSRARQRMHELGAPEKHEGPVDGEFDDSILGEDASVQYDIGEVFEKSEFGDDAAEYFKEE